MLRWDFFDFSDAYIVGKGGIAVTNPDNAKRNKAMTFKNNAHLSTAFQKLRVYKLTTQKT